MSDSSPSITVWQRVEPQSRETTTAPALRGEVRDPLWMLARQWQVGEFLGSDAGSPVDASFEVDSTPINCYQPSNESVPPMQIGQSAPLEALAEQQPVPLGLRGSVQLGVKFEEYLSNALGGTIPGADLIAIRTAYPIQVAVPAGEVPERDAPVYRTLVAGNITDGVKLYKELLAASYPAGQPASFPALGGGENPAVQTAFKQLMAFRSGAYAEPSGAAAWSSFGMDYQFAVGSHATTGDQAFEAPDFPGGRLDWSDFEASSTALSAGGAAGPTAQFFHTLPVHVTFRGMPNNRWWTFDDGTTDFGQIDVGTTDLGRMVVAEFAMAYGGSWFMIPVPLPVESVSQMAVVVVADSFGRRSLVRPTAQQTPPLSRPWTMFTMTGDAPGTDRLLLVGTATDTQDGKPLEAVDLVRDDQAAMGWGIEQTVPGPLDSGSDAYEAYVLRVGTLVNQPPASQQGGPAIYYVLGTTVPDNWFPLVSEQARGGGSPFFRRGVMGSTGSGGAARLPPRGQLLSPSPLFIADQAVPPLGKRVARYYRRTRGSDGQVYVWLSSKVSGIPRVKPSGLVFDQILPMGSPP